MVALSCSYSNGRSEPFQPVAVGVAVSGTEKGGGTAGWRYDLEPQPEGILVRQSYDQRRPVLRRVRTSERPRPLLVRRSASREPAIPQPPAHVGAEGSATAVRRIVRG